MINVREVPVPFLHALLHNNAAVIHTVEDVFACAPGDLERHHANTCTRIPRPPSPDYPMYTRPLQIAIQCNIIFE